MIGEEQTDQEANQYTYEDSRKSNRPSVIHPMHARSREPVGLEMFDVEDGLVVLLQLLCQNRQPVRGLLGWVAYRSSPMLEHALDIMLKDLLMSWSNAPRNRSSIGMS